MKTQEQTNQRKILAWFIITLILLGSGGLLFAFVLLRTTNNRDSVQLKLFETAPEPILNATPIIATSELQQQTPVTVLNLPMDSIISSSPHNTKFAISVEDPFYDSEKNWFNERQIFLQFLDPENNIITKPIQISETVAPYSDCHSPKIDSTTDKYLFVSYIAESVLTPAGKKHMQVKLDWDGHILQTQEIAAKAPTMKQSHTPPIIK